MFLQLLQEELYLEKDMQVRKKCETRILETKCEIIVLRLKARLG